MAFLFADQIWFLAPAPPFRDVDELCRTVLLGMFVEDVALNRVFPIVYAFTDEDLAKRYLIANGIAGYVPVTFSVDAHLVDFLKGLMRHGHTFLGVDIEQESGVVGTISSAVDQIQKR